MSESDLLTRLDRRARPPADRRGVVVPPRGAARAPSAPGDRRRGRCGCRGGGRRGRPARSSPPATAASPASRRTPPARPRSRSTCRPTPTSSRPSPTTRSRHSPVSTASTGSPPTDIPSWAEEYGHHGPINVRARRPAVGRAGRHGPSDRRRPVHLRRGRHHHVVRRRGGVHVRPRRRCPTTSSWVMDVLRRDRPGGGTWTYPGWRPTTSSCGSTPSTAHEQGRPVPRRAVRALRRTEVRPDGRRRAAA